MVKTVAIVRTVGNALVILGYFLVHHIYTENLGTCGNDGGFECTINDITRIFYLASYISGMLGMPSYIFNIWAVYEASDSIIQETWFQVAVFGFLGLNLAILGIGWSLITYQLIN